MNQGGFIVKGACVVFLLATLAFGILFVLSGRDFDLLQGSAVGGNVEARLFLAGDEERELHPAAREERVRFVPGKTLTVKAELALTEVVPRNAQDRHVVQGRVLDELGSALNGVEVRLYSLRRAERLVALLERERRAFDPAGLEAAFRPELHSTSTSDEQGRYRFSSDLAAGTHTLLTFIMHGQAPSTSEFVWPAPKNCLTLPDVHLQAAGVACGSVTNAAGRPIEGATVTLRSLEREGIVNDLTLAPKTDLQGRFRFTNVPPGAFVLGVAAPGHVSLSTRSFEATPRRTVECGVLRLQEAASLEGIVRAPSGVPVAGAQVEASGARSGQVFGAAESQSDGTFVIPGLPFERLRVTASHPDHLTTTHELARPGGPPMTIHLQAGFALHGYVTARSGGHPIERFALRARRVAEPSGSVEPSALLPLAAGEARAHAAGRFQVSGLTPGIHVIDVWAPGFARTAVGPFTVTEAQRPPAIRIELEPAAQLGGQVLSRTSFRPIEARVSLLQNDGVHASRLPRPMRGVRVAVQATDRTGRFAFDGLCRGSYQLLVQAPGHLDVVVEEIELAQGSRTERLVSLTQGARLVGTVRNQDGRGGHVILVHTDGTSQRATIDERGTYEASGLPGGSYRVSLALTSGARSSASQVGVLQGSANLMLTEGATTRFDLDAAAARETILRGQVFMQGQPAVKWHVRYVPEKRNPRQYATGGSLECETNASGFFEFGSVPVGKGVLELRQSLRGRVLSRRDVRIEGGRRVHEVFDIRVGSLTLNVHSETGPARDVTLELVHVDDLHGDARKAWHTANSYRRHVSEDGVFETALLAQGTWHYRVRANGFLTRSGMCDVGPRPHARTLTLEPVRTSR